MSAINFRTQILSIDNIDEYLINKFNTAPTSEKFRRVALLADFLQSHGRESPTTRMFLEAHAKFYGVNTTFLHKGDREKLSPALLQQVGLMFGHDDYHPNALAAKKVEIL